MREALIDIEIQTPPVGKQRPRWSSRGTYTPQRTRDFEALIARHVRKVWEGDPVSGTLGILVEARYKRPAKPRRGHPCHGAGPGRFPMGMGGSGRPDGSNVLKAVEDALNSLVYVDDSQIADTRCVRWWCEEAEPSSVRVVVWRI